jgi:hypothetical protein
MFVDHLSNESLFDHDFPPTAADNANPEMRRYPYGFKQPRMAHWAFHFFPGRHLGQTSSAAR